jgi:hypothetical protein
MGEKVITPYFNFISHQSYFLIIKKNFQRKRKRKRKGDFKRGIHFYTKSFTIQILIRRPIFNYLKSDSATPSCRLSACQLGVAETLSLPCMLCKLE